MQIPKILLLLLLSLFLFSCNEKDNETETVNQIYDEVQMPDQIIRKFEAKFMDDGKLSAILKSGRARVYRTNSETLLDSNVFVEFYSRETGELVSTLESDSAKIDDKTKDMLAIGNVVVISDLRQTILKTTILEWHNEARKIYSSEFVRITNPQGVMTGHGLESDPELKNYTILKPTIIETQNQ
jgi:LPS export ABC transporter protein LptC